MQQRRHMARYISVLVFLTAISASIAVSAESVHTVSPKGPFTSISLAIESAKNGDTIEVYDGTYNEHIIVDKTLNLIGINEPNIDGQCNFIAENVRCSCNPETSWYTVSCIYGENKIEGV